MTEVDGAVLGATEPRILKLSNTLQRTSHIKRRPSLATPPSPIFKVSVYHKQTRQNTDNSEVDAIGAFPNRLSDSSAQLSAAGVLSPD